MERELRLAQESIKLAPPATVAGASMFGIPLDSWILWLTLIYLAFQIIVIAPKAYHTIFDRRKSGRVESESDGSE